MPSPDPGDEHRAEQPVGEIPYATTNDYGPPGPYGPPYGPPDPYPPGPYGQAYGPPGPYGVPYYGPPGPYVVPYGPPGPYGVAPYYGPPYYGAPYVRSPGTNGLAIASLVLGVVWVYWIGSILALILGLVARRQIKQRGQDGDGMAIAGVVLGIIGVASLVLVIVLAVVAVGHDCSDGFC